MGLFDAAAKLFANGDEAVNVEKLASETNVDQLLLSE